MSDAAHSRPDPAFQQGVAWNLASTVVLALGGFALLALLGRRYGQVGLGLFFQVWAPYVILGQVAVGGLDRSVLRALAERELDRRERAPIVWGALLPALVGSAVGALAFHALAEPIAAWNRSPDVAEGVRAASLGLFCFGLNKVLLGVVNGLRRMRAFALYQSLRYVLMPVGVLLVGWLGWPAARASFLFTFTEVLLLAVLLVELATQVALPRTRWLAHVRGHVRYGARSMAAGVLLELNSRVDVWMLGRWVSDGAVGLYGTALQFAEGLFQILIALQNNYNPILARLWGERRVEELHALVRRDGRRALVFMLAISLVAAALFPVALRVLFPDQDFGESWAPFAILMAGIALASIRLPFSQFLLMVGRPGAHSLYMLAVVGVNVLANAALIPGLGIRGAALGTALSFLGSVVLLRLGARLAAGVRL
ncbi:MAG TPA: oligosaccharide flippase family protein [Planctomycetota bacterium]|nr:oligosaccharide flippase family protein [Planctomycetota bacterium]